ncbi:AAA family ATPase [Bradyrhizobium sp. 144]|uniref:AAA family ATPase n=1 Tax=Bradyrhizobium sp. 144 TaxID=2782620 RepID=UPI001FFC1AC5|nr:AAA family ATPase [Bradyrhizobium sp. 144]MCK1693833.1 AAA family ATPase [Bradyrhizobium sp. 144]
MTVSEATMDRAWRVIEDARLDQEAEAADRKAGRYTVKPIWKLSAKPPRKDWIVKGLLARGETSAWIAPPGGMKSALMADLSFALSNGAEHWHGFKTSKSTALIVYFALERADLVRRRLLAHIERAGLSPEDIGELPIFVVADMVDLATPAAVTKVARTLEHISEDFWSDRPGLLIFDTFAKLVAAGGGDEDRAKDQGLVFTNVQRIKDRFGAPHVALVGHTGKDETRGSRGSNAILGDVDVMVTIAGSEVKTATVVKANDMPEGPLFSFKSIVHEFGLDEDGDPITVNIVSPEDVSAQVAAKPAEPRLTENQRVMFRLVHDAGPAGVATEDWSNQARAIGIEKKQRQYELRMALKDKGLVREYNGRWFVSNG